MTDRRRGEHSDRASGARIDAACAASAPGAMQARHIHECLCADDIDAAIEAGLPAFVPLAELDDAVNAALVSARDHLLAAWAARERFRARALRLERIAAERRQARGGREVAPLPGGGASAHVAAVPAAGVPTREAATPAEAPGRPALPPAAAAALARARARVPGRAS